MAGQEPGSIVVISSHVVRGNVGNRAAVFALETRGHNVWALPTIILPWHPGHGRATRIPLDDDLFASTTRDLAASPKRNEIKAVLTGYFASPAQVRAARDLIVSLKADNPDLVYLCDPVVGDDGGLYVPLPIADEIAHSLLPIADLATPNRFELAHFAGRPIDTNAEAAMAAMQLGPKSVLVTSAIPMMAGSTGNLWVTAHEMILAEHRRIVTDRERMPNGLGDLLAALLLSRLMMGDPVEQALQRATSSVFEILSRTVKRQMDELDLAGEASSLVTPMAMVQMRKLIHPARPRNILKPSPVSGAGDDQ